MNAPSDMKLGDEFAFRMILRIYVVCRYDEAIPAGFNLR